MRTAYRAEGWHRACAACGVWNEPEAAHGQGGQGHRLHAVPWTKPLYYLQCQAGPGITAASQGLGLNLASRLAQEHSSGPGDQISLTPRT